MEISKIQDELKKQGLSGWLFFDHHYRDPIAYKLLGLGNVGPVTRRWYYYIPAHGEATALVHKIEPHTLDKLPGRKLYYAGWSQHFEMLKELLRKQELVAMQYSPGCAIPYVALVDAGTVELVRRTGAQIVSSADLIQVFEARLTPQAIESHFTAAKRVDSIRARAFELIKERHRSQSSLNEYEVKQYILEQFAKNDLMTEIDPDVSVNANSSNPHYVPESHNCSQIKSGDFVLIDLFAKLKAPGSIYYDICWTGYCGDVVPNEINNVFQIVKSARNAAIQKVQSAVQAKQTLCGFEVDDAARNFIKAQSFGNFFIHRTGHSIGENIHGNGANMDNFECHDERQVIAGSCFSIEPGIYLPNFGIRSEIDMIVGEQDAQVTGEIQQEVLVL